jgi:teichoic acid transport system ATP-binding protein
MAVRLGFAIAINVDPEILIIDEVLAVGDASFQQKCYQKIESFRKDGKTILFVSHGLGDVTTLCSQVLWVVESQSRAVGRSILDDEHRHWRLFDNTGFVDLLIPKAPTLAGTFQITVGF